MAGIPEIAEGQQVRKGKKYTEDIDIRKGNAKWCTRPDVWLHTHM